MTTPAPQADRYHRAPRGGAVSPVNGLFYAGGRFMPLRREAVEARPAPLAGSTRQILWANRLRREAIAKLEEQLAVARMELAGNKPFDAAGTRRAIRRAEVARQALMTERDAARVIGLRAAMG